MKNKPKHCFDCSTKINPEERKCNVDGHIFEETLGVITSHRDHHCPLDNDEKEDLKDDSEM